MRGEISRTNNKCVRVTDSDMCKIRECVRNMQGLCNTWMVVGFLCRTLDSKNDRNVSYLGDDRSCEYFKTKLCNDKLQLSGPLATT